jgi:hypothetical protein
MSVQIEFGWTKCPPIELVVPGRGLCQPLVLPRSKGIPGNNHKVWGAADHCLSACGELG